MSRRAAARRARDSSDEVSRDTEYVPPSYSSSSSSSSSSEASDAGSASETDAIQSISSDSVSDDAPQLGLWCDACGRRRHPQNFSAAQRAHAQARGTGRCLLHHGRPALSAMQVLAEAPSASTDASSEAQESEEEEEGRVDFGAAFFGAFYGARYSALEARHYDWVRTACDHTGREHAPGFLRLARWVLAREPVLFGRYRTDGLTYAELVRAHPQYVAGVRAKEARATSTRNKRLFLRYLALCER